jgi:hypothetical protein
MPTKAGNPATSGTKGTLAAAEMLATSGTGTHSLAGAQATAMTQATTAMPKTVLTPTTHEFMQKSAKNSSKWGNFVKKNKERECKSPLCCPIDFS